MTKHNLNIHMYSLAEILNLFDLDYQFDIEGLKRAKKKVLMLHPDKSKLDSEYFLFYKKAYETVYMFYEQRMRENKAVENIEYDNQNDKDDTTKMQIGKMMENVSQSEFHNKFNNLFENNMVKKVDESRNDWFKNEDAMYTNSAKGNMGGAINDVKQKQNSLIRYNGIQTIQSNNGGNLYDEDNDSYICSDPFSKLKYDDLRKVHKNETVFAVSENDNYKTYNSMDEYRQVRGSQSLTPMEESQARTVLRENNSNYEKIMMQKQYNANLQTMKNEEKNKSILSNFLRITD